jgi:hypothetical protein
VTFEQYLGFRLQEMLLAFAIGLPSAIAMMLWMVWRSRQRKRGKRR